MEGSKNYTPGGPLITCHLMWLNSFQFLEQFDIKLVNLPCVGHKSLWFRGIKQFQSSFRMLRIRYENCRAVKGQQCLDLHFNLNASVKTSSNLHSATYNILQNNNTHTLLSFPFRDRGEYSPQGKQATSKVLYNNFDQGAKSTAISRHPFWLSSAFSIFDQALPLLLAPAFSFPLI